MYRSNSGSRADASARVTVPAGPLETKTELKYSELQIGDRRSCFVQKNGTGRRGLARGLYAVVGDRRQNAVVFPDRSSFGHGNASTRLRPLNQRWEVSAKMSASAQK